VEGDEESRRESIDEEDINNQDEDEDEDLEEKEGRYLCSIPFLDEDIQAQLTELNDQAIQALLRSDDPATTSGNNNEHALECLKRAEQQLEAVTAEGKDVDRNLIIVVLYNLGCTYQR
jgi:hypothetical protein